VPLTAQADWDFWNNDDERETRLNRSSGDSYVEQSYMRETRQMTPMEVRDLQESLALRGFYNGRIDGVWGPQTDRAVRDYQISMGQQPSGILTVAEFNQLNMYGNNMDVNRLTDISPAAGIDMDDDDVNYYSVNRTCDIVTTTTRKVEVVTDGPAGHLRGKPLFRE
jgi:hypothetical protein